MTATIDRFRGTHRFLSNTYLVPVTYNGYTYPSAEHAFQATKTVTVKDHQRIADATSPHLAKRLGSRVKLRPDWNLVRDTIMADILVIKFTAPQLHKALQRTAPAELIEGNYWHDNYWGDCTCSDCASTPGLNTLGRILMQLRDGAGAPVGVLTR